MPAKKETREYTISVPLVFTLTAKDSKEARKVAGHLEDYLKDAVNDLRWAYNYPIELTSKSPIATICATKSDKGN